MLSSRHFLHGIDKKMCREFMKSHIDMHTPKGPCKVEYGYTEFWIPIHSASCTTTENSTEKFHHQTNEHAGLISQGRDNLLHRAMLSCSYPLGFGTRASNMLDHAR